MIKNNKHLFSFLYGILLIISYQMIFPLIYFTLLKKLATSNNFWIKNITYIGYYIIVLFLLIFIYRKSLKKEWTQFKKNPKELIKKGLSLWLQGFITMAMSNLIIINFTNNIAGNEELNRQIITQMPLYAITLMCFIGPFIEELVFRKSFRPAFKNKYVYALITSFIFASLHVLNGFEVLTFSHMLENWTQWLFLLPYGSLAFFFAIAYFETDNIFTSTIAHCFQNSLSVLLILLV
ncbi:MAG: CPBP family intramembrane metalloprotease [Bacilli bacterium]|nr:CPBP family intramembrane metalloprotease [Bacilli bacterium]